MRKNKLVLLIFILILSAVHAAAAGDGTAVVTVGDAVITREMAERRASSGMAMTSASSLSDEEKESARDEAFDRAVLSLIAEQACLNEAERLGLDLDGSIETETERIYHRMIEAIESYVRVSYPNLDRDAMDEQVDSLLKVIGESRESYRETARRSAMIAALEAYWMDHYPEPSDEEVRQYYDELYSVQKELFDADENEFESAMLNGKLVVYRPRDLKLIRKAEFLFRDDVAAFLRQARQLGVSNADKQIMDQYHALADEVEPVYEDLLSGKVSFTEVMEGLKEGSSSQINYFNPESTRFAADYYDRANAFTETGEISTAYIIPNGYAVLEYYGDIPAGSLTVEEASEGIRAAIREEASKEYLTEMRQDLLDRAEIRFIEGGQ